MSGDDIGVAEVSLGFVKRPDARQAPTVLIQIDMRESIIGTMVSVELTAEQFTALLSGTVVAYVIPEFTQ